MCVCVHMCECVSICECVHAYAVPLYVCVCLHLFVAQACLPPQPRALRVRISMANSARSPGLASMVAMVEMSS